MRLRIGILWITLAMGLPIAGQATPPFPSPSSIPERIVRFRLAGEPTTLDWNLAHTPFEIYLLMNLMEGLVRLPASLKPEPALATQWKVMDGGKRYVFTLRDGVTWSDGVPLTAQHFVDSWKRLLAPLTAAPYAYFLFDIEGAAEYHAGKISDFSNVGVRAVDERTLEVRLKQASSDWIYIPSFWVCFPIRLDLIEKHGVGWERPGKMATIGAFLLSQYDEGQKYVLRPNPFYWGERPGIDQLIGVVVPNASDAIERFRKGQLDVATQLSSDVDKIEKSPELKKHLRSFPYLRTLYLGMNLSRFPTQRAGLRRAIGHSLSQTQLAQEASIRGRPATSFVPPGISGHDPSGTLPFNVEKARAELRAEGLSVATLPEIELMVSDAESNPLVGKKIAESLEKHLSLRIRLNVLPVKTYTVRRRMKTAELFLSSWVADYPDASNFLSVFHSDSGNNFTHYRSDAFDTLLQNARALASPSEREKAYLSAQKRLLQEDAVLIPLFSDVNDTLLSDQVSGVEITPLNHLFFKRAKRTP